MNTTTSTETSEQIVKFLETAPPCLSRTIALQTGLPLLAIQKSLLQLLKSRVVDCSDGEEPIVRFWLTTSEFAKKRRGNAEWQ